MFPSRNALQQMLTGTLFTGKDKRAPLIYIHWCQDDQRHQKQSHSIIYLFPTLHPTKLHHQTR